MQTAFKGKKTQNKSKDNCLLFTFLNESEIIVINEGQEYKIWYLTFNVFANTFM